MNPFFVKPRYDSGGFAGLPAAIQASFNCQKPCPQFQGDYDNIILGFVDGFGWRHFEKFGAHPFLDRFTRSGSVDKLTSQFPSTTSCLTTCIHTGLNVGQSGIIEWNYYVSSQANPSL